MTFKSDADSFNSLRIPPVCLCLCRGFVRTSLHGRNFGCVHFLLRTIHDDSFGCLNHLLETLSGMSVIFHHSLVDIVQNSST